MHEWTDLKGFIEEEKEKVMEYFMMSWLIDD